MPQVTHVLIDPATDAGYYLGFDLLLVRAPVVEGEIRTDEGRVVEADREDAQLAARYAAIKLALLTAQLGDDEAWRSMIQEARTSAHELACAARLASPPRL